MSEDSSCTQHVSSYSSDIRTPNNTLNHEDNVITNELTSNGRLSLANNNYNQF